MAEERSDRVRRRAYEIWEKEGRQSGREREHWAQAEREIGGEAPPRKSAGKAKAGASGNAESKPAKPAKSRAAKPKKA